MGLTLVKEWRGYRVNASGLDMGLMLATWIWG